MFRKTGSVTPPKRKGSVKRVAVADNIDRVKTLYEEQPRGSLRATARDLHLSYRSLRVILKEDLKMKPYKIHRCQELTNQHKEQRIQFCQWFMEGDIDWGSGST
jgi:AraC-like DNA-binding protein